MHLYCMRESGGVTARIDTPPSRGVVDQQPQTIGCDFLQGQHWCLRTHRRVGDISPQYVIPTAEASGDRPAIANNLALLPPERRIEGIRPRRHRSLQEFCLV